MVRARAAGALLITLAWTTAAAAAEPTPRYLYMGGGGGGDQGKVAGFLDLGGLVREGDVATLPILLIPDEPAVGPLERNFGIVIHTFNCKTRTEQSKVYRAYLATGVLLGESPIDMPARPVDTTQPDAVAAIAMACGETSPAPDQPTFSDPLEAAKWSRARPRTPA